MNPLDTMQHVLNKVRDLADEAFEASAVADATKLSRLASTLQNTISKSESYAAKYMPINRVRELMEEMCEGLFAVAERHLSDDELSIFQLTMLASVPTTPEPDEMADRLEKEFEQIAELIELAFQDKVAGEICRLGGLLKVKHIATAKANARCGRLVSAKELSSYRDTAGKATAEVRQIIGPELHNRILDEFLASQPDYEGDKFDG